jgi:hypothetical protein
MNKCFNYEKLGVFDEIFFLDDYKNNSIVLGTMFLDKFDFDQMK